MFCASVVSDQISHADLNIIVVPVVWLVVQVTFMTGHTLCALWRPWCPCQIAPAPETPTDWRIDLEFRASLKVPLSALRPAAAIMERPAGEVLRRPAEANPAASAAVTSGRRRAIKKRPVVH